MNLETKIAGLRLYLDSTYENVASNFCNLKGSSADVLNKKTHDKFLLANWYEGYLYSSLLGIKINERIERSGKALDKAPKWSHAYIDQLKYSFSLLLTLKDVQHELKLDSRKNILESGVTSDIIIEDLKKICDEYCWGGLNYLKELYKNDDDVFSDYMALRNIYEDAGK